MEWKKSFSSHISEMRLMSKIYKELITQCEKNTRLIFKGSEELTRESSKKTSKWRTHT